ncbi:hypothetical protein ACG9ZE_22865, partial [Acinetobacter sp. ULE_I053]|uniref:hypothetical protein n=1 Tax=Acinetobacter sp. ULE_I053 TaxID=3373069 RepID=UPI003AF84B21
GAQYGFSQVNAYRTETAGSNYVDAVWFWGWNPLGADNTQPITGFQMEHAYRNGTNDAFFSELFSTSTGTNRTYEYRPFRMNLNLSNGE